VNSFISSFRPLLAAIAIIGLIEGAIALIVAPDIVARSNYLNWMYGAPDPFHKFLIAEKMREVSSSEADVIQVGDSSGFHGIRPKLIEKEVGNVRYFNLSCCANTGFDGYYDVAKFALNHDPKLRAIVLYITFNNLPRPALIGGDAQLGAAKIHEAYVGPWSIIALPSIALRPAVTNAAYSLFDLVAPRYVFTAGRDSFDMMESVQKEHGWWAEHDPRSVGDKDKQFFRQLCGPNDLRDIGTEILTSTNGEFLPLVTFDKFAALAKDYNQKLIIVFHPHPCSHLNEKTMHALEDSLSMLKRKYANLYVYPEGLFEHWPREIFTSADHLYVGYERFSSRRLARFVAAALELPSKPVDDTPIPIPSSSLIRANEKPVWENGNLDDRWHLEGVVVRPASESSWWILETAQNEQHSLKTQISGLVPDRYYLLAVSYKPIGNRILSLSLGDGVRGPEGSSWCDPENLEAGRHADFYDGSMIVNTDGSIVCWGIVKVTAGQAYLGIDLLRPKGGGTTSHQADKRAGLLLRNISLYMRSSPDVVVDGEEVDH
jgi:hypothetical protein